jgi:acetylornithine deacetylase/succinyl-diaminopimelate desuccinylase-like protein
MNQVEQAENDTLPLRATVNKRRLMRDLNAIGRIGIGDHGAVTRLVFSIKELRSRQLLIHLMQQAGLKIQIDTIGNIFGRFEGSDPKAPAVLAAHILIPLFTAENMTDQSA